LKSIGGRGGGGTPDDKKDSWKQIYNSLAKIKKERNERKNKKGKSSNFSSSYVSISGVFKIHM
jgi:hypothetical protein